MRLEIDPIINPNLHKLSLLKTIKEVNTTYPYNSFKHPELSAEALRLGCRLGLDSWEDTGCSRRHAYVEEFVIRKIVTTTGFSTALGKLDNLPYAHVLYTYDHEDGWVLLLEHNNTIYMQDNMNDWISNPIQ